MSGDLRSLGPCPRCQRPVHVRAREGVKIGDKIRLRCPHCHATMTGTFPMSDELRDSLQSFRGVMDRLLGEDDR